MSDHPGDGCRAEKPGQTNRADRSFSILHRTRSLAISKSFYRLRIWRRRRGWLAMASPPHRLSGILDVGVSLVLLVLLAPVFLVVAALIKLTDGGPAIVWQPRVGRSGQPFALPQFRSLALNATELKTHVLQHAGPNSALIFQIQRMPRFTWIGHVIRALGIERLPRLWSVFRGQTSFRGPSPAISGQQNGFMREDGPQRDVTPSATQDWLACTPSDTLALPPAGPDARHTEVQRFRVDPKHRIPAVQAVHLKMGAG